MVQSEIMEPEDVLFDRELMCPFEIKRVLDIIIPAIFKKENIECERINTIEIEDSYFNNI